ncbi:MAG TPA: hypothetical protein VKB51_13820 [bacterium]|nr:hypothetical protein [bacterium]
MPPSTSSSPRETLYRLREVQALLPGEGSIGPITWAVRRGQRIGVRCASDAQWETLRALLTGERSPVSGWLDEVTPVTVQTDAHLRKVLRPGDSLQDFLDGPDAPEFVRLEGRRHSLMVLVDLLDITPAMRRCVFKFGSPSLLERVWALRFLISRADVLIGREVFRIADPPVRVALRRRWGDWPGTLIAGEGDQPLPGALDGWARLDAEGHFSAGNLAAPPEDGP